jgi:glutamate-5-semialdehyde dehydrogenase
MTSTVSYLSEVTSSARTAARRLARIGRHEKDAALLRIADLLESAPGPVLEANAADVDAARAAGLD